jgi:hypothetical protein
VAFFIPLLCIIKCDQITNLVFHYYTMKNILYVILLASTYNLSAQVKADLAQLNFMAGNWRGSMEWGELEEIWSEARGDNMMCVFRCVKDDKALFYEFVIIEQSDSGTPIMKLRHFDRGNIAWEEKDKPFEYPLTILKNNRAVFESKDRKTRLIYELQSKNKLLAVLEHEKDGKLETDTFLYTRK